MSAQRRALVTGGAGFIGSELVGQLVAAGWHVTVLDNLCTGRWVNLQHLPPGSVERIDGDVRDRPQVTSLVARVDTVFHLACRSLRFGLREPVETHDVNAGGTLGLLEACRGARLRRLVHVSSSEVYGLSPHMPLDENAPTLPTTAYGASKLAGEAYARAYQRSYGVPVTIVRPFNAFGPRAHHEGDAGEVIPKFILRALTRQPLTLFGEGNQTRDFTFVSDTARGLRLAASNDAALGATINLGSGTEVSMRALAEAVLAAVGDPRAALRFDAPRPGDLPRLVANTAKAERLLRYRPEIAFASGLARLIDEYRRDPQIAARLVLEDVVRNWESSDA